MKKFEKLIIPGVCEKLLFWNNGSECLFILYLIIVLVVVIIFNQETFSYYMIFKKDLHQYNYYKQQ